MFASWSYDGGKVVIRPREANNSLEYYIENTEWKLDVGCAYLHKCCPNTVPFERACRISATVQTSNTTTAAWSRSPTSPTSSVWSATHPIIY